MFAWSAYYNNLEQSLKRKTRKTEKERGWGCIKHVVDHVTKSSPFIPALVTVTLHEHLATRMSGKSGLKSPTRSAILSKQNVDKFGEVFFSFFFFSMFKLTTSLFALAKMWFRGLKATTEAGPFGLSSSWNGFNVRFLSTCFILTSHMATERSPCPIIYDWNKKQTSAQFFQTNIEEYNTFSRQDIQW